MVTYVPHCRQIHATGKFPHHPEISQSNLHLSDLSRSLQVAQRISAWHISPVCCDSLTYRVGRRRSGQFQRGARADSIRYVMTFLIVLGVSVGGGRSEMMEFERDHTRIWSKTNPLVSRVPGGDITGCLW